MKKAEMTIYCPFCKEELFYDDENFNKHLTKVLEEVPLSAVQFHCPCCKENWPLLKTDFILRNIVNEKENYNEMF